MKDRPALDPSTILERSTDALGNELDGETVLLRIESGRYYGLDAVGTAIWEALEQPRSFQEVIDLLRERFEVSAEQCHAETTGFVARLLEEGLLHRR